MSTSFSPTTLVKALDSASRFIGGNVEWRPTNVEQDYLMQKVLPEYLHEIGKLPELEGRASTNITELNTWLRERGFDIQLDALTGTDSFGAVGISDITVEWLTTASRLEIKDGYPAFQLDSGIDVHQMVNQAFPHIRLETKSGDIVCLMETSGRPHDTPKDFQDLLYWIQVARSPSGQIVRRWSSVVIPMVKLIDQPDISWLGGLSSGNWSVGQALQEVRFAMNQTGARSKEATAMTFRGLSAAPLPYVVERPFFLWIERPGVNVPIFQAHITPDDWADPGDLDSI